MIEKNETRLIDFCGAPLDWPGLQLILDALNADGRCAVQNVQLGSVNFLSVAVSLLWKALQEANQEPDTQAKP